MYTVLLNAYEVHGAYYCTAELMYGEGEHPESVARVTWTEFVTAGVFPDEHGDILSVLSSGMSRIARKLDVPLF